MKQLSLFNHGKIDESKDFSIFDNEVTVVKEYPNEPTMKINNPKHLLSGNYVRTKDNNSFFLNGLFKSQLVFVGYEKKKNRSGEIYMKDIFELRERAYSEIYDSGKVCKEIIRHEDIILQSPFLIDLCFQNDMVIGIDHKIYFVEHKVLKPPIWVDSYKKNDNNEIIKEKILKSKSYLVCNHGKIILHEKDIISLVYNPKFNYENFLEEGMEILCDYWGWCKIEKIMSRKVLCSSERTKMPIFVYFNQIVDVRD